MTGEEDVLKDELVELLIAESVDAASRDFNLDVRSAGDLSAESLHTLVETPPMLAARRVAVVRNLEQWRKNSKPWQVLASYLDSPSPTTTLVLVHGAGQDADAHLAKRATHVSADPPDAAELTEWVAARAERSGIGLEPDAAAHLLAACGRNLSQVAAELDKLAAAALDGGPVSADTVARFVGVRRGETPFDWVSAVIARDMVRAIDLLDVVLQQSGVTGVNLLMSLGTALMGTRLVRALRDEGQSPRQIRSAVIGHLKGRRIPGLGPWNEEVNRWSAAADRWTARELDALIAHAYAADRQLKDSTLSDARGTLYSMLLLCSAPKEVT